MTVLFVIWFAAELHCSRRRNHKVTPSQLLKGKVCALSTITFAYLNALNLSTLPVYSGTEKPLCEGPRILPVLNLSFATIQRYELDYSNQMKTGRMSLVQSAYIDASNIGGGPGGLLIEFPNTGQHIFAHGATQGYYPCLASDPLRVVFECHAGGLATIIFCNFMVPPIVWQSDLV